MSSVAAICSEGQIDINSAPLNELDKLYGIGPVKAQAIIDYRENKFFENVNELIEVNGIGEATLSGIKKQGLACVKDEQENSGEGYDEPESSKNVSANSSYNDSNENVDNINYLSTNNLQTQNTKVEPNVIRLNTPIESSGDSESGSKDIKTEESSENQELGKNKILMYGFFAFGIFMGILLMLKRKTRKNDFE